MKTLFSRKSPAERRDSIAADLQAALATADAERAAAVQVALAGGDLDAADVTVARHEQRVATLTAALAQIDKEITESQLAAAQAKITGERKRAAAYCTDLADRAESLAAAHEMWLLVENAALINEYRKAIGHDSVDFRSEACGARVNLNDLRVVNQQFRERAERIMAGRGDEEVQRMLAMATK